MSDNHGISGGTHAQAASIRRSRGHETQSTADDASATSVAQARRLRETSSAPSRPRTERDELAALLMQDGPRTDAEQKRFDELAAKSRAGTLETPVPVRRDRPSVVGASDRTAPRHVEAKTAAELQADELLRHRG
jgi:hypothetical protein